VVDDRDDGRGAAGIGGGDGTMTVENNAIAFLHAHGVGDDQIERATKTGRLHLLVLEHLSLAGTPQYTEHEIAELSGLSLDDLKRFWRALGFPDVAKDERVFTEHDLDVLGTVTGSIAMGVTDLEVAIQLTRVYGSSMARIADAEVQMSVARTPEESERLAELYALTAGGSLTGVAAILEHVWRRHLQVAIRRQTMSEVESEGSMAVGFCDLVGFTAMSQQLNEEDLAAVVARFEELAYDTVAAGGGRVVKMIGDEVMFVVESAHVAAHIGIALADAYSDEETLSDVRVGIAFGPVLGREGDYFGPVVNMASRIVNIAFPGSVVVSAEVADAVRDDTDLDVRSMRPRLLKDIGRVPLFVVSRPGEDHPGWKPRSRSVAPAREVVKAVLGEVARRHLERRAASADANGGDSERADGERPVKRLERPTAEVDEPT
jgi:adenylate cyclase